jgi:hypothetical protein
MYRYPISPRDGRRVHIRGSHDVNVGILLCCFSARCCYTQDDGVSYVEVKRWQESTCSIVCGLAHPILPEAATRGSLYTYFRLIDFYSCLFRYDIFRNEDYIVSNDRARCEW